MRASDAIVAELKSEVEITLPAEKEKTEIPQPEPLHETHHAPEPAPTETPTAPEAQPTPKPESAPAQTVVDPHPGDMVYVKAFGWLACQALGEITCTEDMYENGNKIGSMS